MFPYVGYIAYSLVNYMLQTVWKSFGDLRLYINRNILNCACCLDNRQNGFHCTLVPLAITVLRKRIREKNWANYTDILKKQWNFPLCLYIIFALLCTLHAPVFMHLLCKCTLFLFIKLPDFTSHSHQYTDFALKLILRMDEFDVLIYLL